MDNIDTLITRIVTYLEAAPHGTAVRMARKLGIHPARLVDAKKPGWNPQAETIRNYLTAIDEMQAEDAAATATRADPLADRVCAM